MSWEIGGGLAEWRLDGHKGRLHASERADKAEFVGVAVRLSIGLEDFDDLRADFEAASKKVVEASREYDSGFVESSQLSSRTNFAAPILPD